MIYAVTDGRYVKIGYTGGEVGKRVATLQTGSVAKLAMLGQFRGEREDERRIHAEFAHRRVAGEWFDLTVEEVGGLVRREDGNVRSERTFSRDGMIAILTEAVNRRMREAGFALLTTMKPSATSVTIGAGLIVCSYCEQARDEVVDAMMSAVSAESFPSGCASLSRCADDGRLSVEVVVSHAVYDLVESAAAGNLLTYEQASQRRSIVEHLVKRGRKLVNAEEERLRCQRTRLSLGESKPYIDDSFLSLLIRCRKHPVTDQMLRSLGDAVSAGEDRLALCPPTEKADNVDF